MKRFLAAAVVFAAFSPAAFGSSPQESLNQVYEAPGTAAEIAKRAQTCIAQHLRNDSVQLFSAVAPARQADGGDVLSMVDVEGGILVANHRVKFRSWGTHFAESTLTVRTKDGRFKMDTTDIICAQQNTGGIYNDGFVPYREKAKGFKAAVAAIGAVQQKLVDCIQQGAVVDDDW